MRANTLKRTLTVTATAALLAFGFSMPGHAASMEYVKTYYYFTWNGYKIQIPVWTKIHPTKFIALTKTGTTTPAPSTQAASPAVSAPASSQTANQTAVSEVQKVVDLVNAERAKAGLAPLKVNTSLAKMAQVKAEDMRDHKYFSHNSPAYGSPFNMMKSFGISYSYAGENIAAGQKTPEEVMKSWMNSPGHKANILNKNFTEIGVGLAKGGNYGTYWVQEFIRP